MGAGHRGQEILHRCKCAFQHLLLKFLFLGVREWYTHYKKIRIQHFKHISANKIHMRYYHKQPVSPYGLRCLYTAPPLSWGILNLIGISLFENRQKGMPEKTANEGGQHGLIVIIIP